MIKLVKTTSENPDFKALVKLLDADLAVRDGDEHEFYDQFNKLDQIKHVVLAYEGNQAIGCGAIKHFTSKTMEIKRMYSRPEARGKGIATKVLTELELWAKALGYQRCILETGVKQPEAIGLYNKTGYSSIPNYGQYVGMDSSVCFAKVL